MDSDRPFSDALEGKALPHELKMQFIEAASLFWRTGVLRTLFWREARAESPQDLKAVGQPHAGLHKSAATACA